MVVGVVVDPFPLYLYFGCTVDVSRGRVWRAPHTMRRVRNERPEPRERPEHPARAIGAASIGSPHIIVLHTQRSKCYQELG